MAHDTNELVVAGDVGITPQWVLIVTVWSWMGAVSAILRSASDRSICWLTPLVSSKRATAAILQHDEECDGTDDDGLRADEDPQEGGDGDREADQGEVEVVGIHRVVDEGEDR